MTAVLHKMKQNSFNGNGIIHKEFWPRLVILVVVNIIIVFVVSVMYSHQIAGPAYKLENSIKRITEGDLTFEVSLRRNDNLKELASALILCSKNSESLWQGQKLLQKISQKSSKFLKATTDLNSLRQVLKNSEI